MAGPTAADDADGVARSRRVEDDAVGFVEGEARVVGDEAAEGLLDGTIRGLEASKDLVVSAAPVPGLGVAIDLTVELLKKIQVRFADEAPEVTR